MGRLSEYDEEERAVICAASPEVGERFWSDAELGKKVRELLASVPDDVHAPLALIRFMVDNHGEFGYPGAAWAWFREQLLGDQPGTLKTGGAVGDDELICPECRRPYALHGLLYGLECPSLLREAVRDGR